MQQGRKVPIKLRVEVQPERLFDKILDQVIEKITVRELLGLSPDLLHDSCGIRKLPLLNNRTISCTQVADIGLGATWRRVAQQDQRICTECESRFALLGSQRAICMRFPHGFGKNRG